MLMVMLMVDCRVHVPGLVVLLLSTLRTIMIMREEWWPAHIQTSLLVSSLFYELARTRQERNGALSWSDQNSAMTKSRPKTN
jgi:hypothetical protein